MDEVRKWLLEGYLDESRSMRRSLIWPLPFRIGRRHDLELQCHLPSVSGRHAELFTRDETLLIRDLGSTNGTFVNRERVKDEKALRSGDVVHVGRAEFRVRREEDPDVLDGATIDITSAAAGLPSRLAVGTRPFAELMEQKAVEPWFQPIVELPSGRILGHELLGRGSHEGLAASPVELFRIAEEVGRDRELSRLFRSVGIRAAHDLSMSGALFLNSTPAEMDDEELVNELRGLAELAPEVRLTLEIHESSVKEPTRMRALRDSLKELGVGLAYDDFGAGRTRLMELAEVPPDVLKFDMKLVQGLDKATSSVHRVVGTMVELANDLGIPCLAEGVERREEADACIELGFTQAQGYLFGRPSPQPCEV